MSTLRCLYPLTVINTVNYNVQLGNVLHDNYCIYNACPHLFKKFDCGNLTCPHNNLS